MDPCGLTLATGRVVDAAVCFIASAKGGGLGGWGPAEEPGVCFKPPPGAGLETWGTALSPTAGVIGEGGFIPAPILADAEGSLPTLGPVDGTAGFGLFAGISAVGVCDPILGTGTLAGGVGGLLTWLLVGGSCAVAILLLPTGAGRGGELSFEGSPEFSGKGACTPASVAIGSVVAFVPSPAGIGLGTGGGSTTLLLAGGTGRGAVGFSPCWVAGTVEGGGSTLLATGSAGPTSAFSVAGTDFGDCCIPVLGFKEADGNGVAGFVCSETGLVRKQEGIYNYNDI